MNEQVSDDSATTRKLTDAALLLVAISAVAAWVCRKLRRSATVDTGAIVELPAADSTPTGTPDSTSV